MKKILKQLFSCTTMPQLENCRYTRLFEDHFRLNVSAEGWKESFDMRDLLKFDYMEWGLRGDHVKNKEFTNKINKQFSMYDIYEDALAKIKCSTNDTPEIYKKLINQQLQESKHHDFFESPTDPDGTIELVFPFSLKIIQIICQLTSGWCNESKILLTDDSVISILEASQHLFINRNKQVDVFTMENDAPLHMRIKVIDLFCINFVYQLERNALLSKYRFLLKNTIIETTEKEKVIVSVFKRMGNPLLSYIHHLEIKIENGQVSKLFLHENSKYFTYKQHYQEKCKVIFLKQESNIEESSEKLNLIKELNMINRAVENRRLVIVLPFFDDMINNTGKLPRDFPRTSFVQDFYFYTGLMEILPELQEVYIYNLLPYYKTVPYAREEGDFLDELFVKTVNTVLNKLKKLSSLYIQGFDEFPQELVPRLQEKSLKKFGVLGNCGKIDYLVIHKIFTKECSLRRTINHLIGHFRAVQLFFQITEKKELGEVTVCDSLFGANNSLSEADMIYSEHIKKYFVDGNLSKAVIVEKPLNIGKVYYINPLCIVVQLTSQTLSRRIQYRKFLNVELTSIDATEFLTGSLITHLVIQLETNTEFIRNFFKTALNVIPTIISVEIIINHNFWKDLLDLELDALRLPSNRELCLIFNVRANSMLYSEMIYALNEDSTLAIYQAFNEDFTFAIYQAFNDVVVKNKNNVKFKVKRRQMESLLTDSYNTKNKFIEFCRNENLCNDENAFSRLYFEEIPYDVDYESALRTIHL
ncbi:hypothetical protein ENBRE01_1940 [Enteropsectra breve]|nr:hypothetical protein ENBRE01_1940 [Enteropsectra breve]